MRPWERRGLWTLEQGLGEAFSSEVRTAWAAAYGWLAFTMQRAAAMSAVAVFFRRMSV